MIKQIIDLDYVKNPFKEIGENFALVTAGGKDGYNPMTVSWGSVGKLWNKNVIILFIRPERATWTYLEKNPKFTVSFFNGEYKENLTLAGRISGHDYKDKFSEIGLTPIYDVDADIYYAKEASYIFKCSKLYVGDIEEDGFIDKSLIEKFYGSHGGYHKVVVAQINSYFVNEE
jgi:flavin reductase (DIM6/NTAB) family NADH-FMN oxidoreductase RutF